MRYRCIRVMAILVVKEEVQYCICNNIQYLKSVQIRYRTIDFWVTNMRAWGPECSVSYRRGVRMLWCTLDGQNAYLIFARGTECFV